MKTTSQITLENKLGRFTFGKDVPIALAKLLRDSVTAQYFSPQQGNQITDEDRAQEFVYEHCCRDLSQIPFKLNFADEFRPKKRVVHPTEDHLRILHFLDEESLVDFREPPRLMISEYHDALCAVTAYGGVVCTCIA